MTKNSKARPCLRLHLTNVAGAGATQLLLSLLPALERNVGVRIAEIYLPDRGELSKHQTVDGCGVAKHYHRWLPNALSRLLECMIFSRKFDGSIPLLVLGDVPLRSNVRQTVFVQTPHICSKERLEWTVSGVKFAIMRLIFRFNSRYVAAFIVQTSVMRDALNASYPAIAPRVHVLAQPVPAWLLDFSPVRQHSHTQPGESLRLIYPAAFYPHKNHKLLADIKPDSSPFWPIQSLQLTLPLDMHPAKKISWIECVGFLSADEMIQAYRAVDGILFLSTEESYGFPLVEAMFVGLPIVCPDLPYARALCWDGAIYFDPRSIDSLRNAIGVLHQRLAKGWWPDWTAQLAGIPKNWDAVAQGMIDLACDPLD